MREDLERRLHHGQPRRTTHWHGEQLVVGSVDDCPTPVEPPEDCPNCGGTGTLPVGIETGPLHAGQVEHEGCPTCDGRGTR